MYRPKFETCLVDRSPKETPVSPRSRLDGLVIGEACSITAVEMREGPHRHKNRRISGLWGLAKKQKSMKSMGLWKWLPEKEWALQNRQDLGLKPFQMDKQTKKRAVRAPQKQVCRV